jgi:hypothetical protein
MFSALQCADMIRPVALVICLALAACGDSQVQKLEKVKEAVCACKTARCAETALGDVPQQQIVSNHRTQEVAREMLDCMAKLYDAERPSTDPDAPAE